MGMQHEENLPASFAESFSGKFLGDPDVVAGLVGGFCASIEQLMNGGASSKEDFVEKANSLVREYADIFSGRNTSYRAVAGFNNVTLPAKLRADLGEFWALHREKWGDDSVCVFFEWLFVNMAEFIKRADGDDDLLEIMAKPTVQQAVQHLMGTEQRRA